MKLNGGTLNTVNGVVTDFALGGFTLSADSNFYADVDLANSKMDNFLNTPTTYTGGTLNVAGLNLISDATSVNTSIPFANDTLKAHVNYAGGQGLTALSQIYKYNVGYDSSNGNFDFTRYNSGGYDGLNPAIMTAPVAEVKDVLNNNYQAILNWLNIENVGIINAIGIESVEHLKTTSYPTQAYELGKSL